MKDLAFTIYKWISIVGFVQLTASMPLFLFVSDVFLSMMWAGFGCMFLGGYFLFERKKELQKKELIKRG